jgi:hypothetical protein
MTQSIGDALLPRSLPEILRHTLVMYVTNLRDFVSTSAVVLIPFTIVQVVLSMTIIDDVQPLRTGQSAEAGMQAVLGPTLIVFALIFLLQLVLLNGVLTYVTSEQLLGRKVTPLHALEQIRGRLLPLAIALVMVGISLVFMSLILAVFYFLCGLGFGIIIYLSTNLFTLLVPVIILERVAVFDGIIRAWGLSKRRFWPIAVLLLVVLIGVLVISVVVDVIGSLLLPTDTGQINFPIVLLNLVIQVFIAPVMPIAVTLMYYDTRLRVEGVDIALEALNKTDPRPSDLPSPYIPLHFTRRDLKDVALVSIIGVGLVLIVAALVLATTDISRLQ